MTPPETDLGTAELEVLRTLWDDNPATVRDVMNRLHERGRRVAYTTVLTFLTRLEQKGYVTSDKSDVAYRYQPAVTRENVSRSRLRNLLDVLYDGAAAPLVLQLMRDEPFTAEELVQLQLLIERLDARTRAATGRRRGSASPATGGSRKTGPRPRRREGGVE
jgi:predicted transcriptional regulator